MNSRLDQYHEAQVEGADFYDARMLTCEGLPPEERDAKRAALSFEKLLWSNVLRSYFEVWE